MNPLGSEPLTWRRYAAGSTVGLDWTPGDATSGTLYGSVQPAGPERTQTLKEGERARDPRLLITRTALRVVSQDGQTPADQVDIDGIAYEVREVQQFRKVQPHYEVTLLRLQETAP